VGKGSAFTVSLPLREAEAPKRERADAPLTPAGAGRSVLVVDDNDINLFVAVALLKKAGYKTSTAKGGQEAVDLVSSTDFDAVLMDCQMPELDGYEATRRVRALDSPRRRTPIIALTASALPEELERCIEAGMDVCLTKPVTLDALTVTLATVLESRRLAEGKRGAA
jgi:CheY-like chemotaxis protein